MSAGWNFERRRDTCARFLIGVWLLAEGVAGRETSLEAVRHRVRLDPEEALFAARRLKEEELIAYSVGGAVTSNPRGIERAAALLAGVRAKAQRFDEVTRMLRAGGTALDVVAVVIRADGGGLGCAGPDADATYRLALVGGAVTLEALGPTGDFGPVSLDG